MDDDNFSIGGQNSSTTRNLGFHLSKSDNDLFKDEMAKIIAPVFEIKRKETKKAGENWLIIKDKEIIMEIKAYRLNNTEKSFFRSIDGIKYLMDYVKQDKDLNIVKIKQDLKNKGII